MELFVGLMILLFRKKAEGGGRPAEDTVDEEPHRKAEADAARGGIVLLRSMCACMYVYIYIYMYICIYTYTIIITVIIITLVLVTTITTILIII